MSETKIYTDLQTAFERFNADLFGGKLRPVIFTLNRVRSARGYFAAQRFASRTDDEKRDEIALNPDAFAERSDLQILSTLLHEMVHLWQQQFGKPSRKNYHNKQWADKMEDVGLMPSNTGQPGGKRTGQSMTHYIIDEGPFSEIAQRLLDDGFAIEWASLPIVNTKETSANKVKYTCPICDLNAWGKPELFIICGECQVNLEEAA